MAEMASVARAASEALDLPLMIDAPIGDCERVHVVGMLDAPSFVHTLRNTARARSRVIHWCGPDVALLARVDVLPEAVHVCDSEGLRAELDEWGIHAKVVPWPTPRHFEVTPFPDSKQVSVYLGREGTQYGNSVALALDDALPEATVRPYAFGEFDGEGMRDLVAASRVYFRPTAHDGGAVGAKEYLEAGRRVVMSTPQPFAIHVANDDLPAAVAAVREALSHDEPDHEAAEYWKTENSPDRFRSQMEEVL
jgi:hypothetical protein